MGPEAQAEIGYNSKVTPVEAVTLRDGAPYNNGNCIQLDGSLGSTKLGRGDQWHLQQQAKSIDQGSRKAKASRQHSHRGSRELEAIEAAVTSRQQRVD